MASTSRSACPSCAPRPTMAPHSTSPAWAAPIPEVWSRRCSSPRASPQNPNERVQVSAIDDLPPLRDVIARHDLRAKKSLGQNFLLDLNLTGRIARAAGPLAGVTVVEV